MGNRGKGKRREKGRSKKAKAMQIVAEMKKQSGSSKSPNNEPPMGIPAGTYATATPARTFAMSTPAGTSTMSTPAGTSTMDTSAVTSSIGTPTRRSPMGTSAKTTVIDTAPGASLETTEFDLIASCFSAPSDLDNYQ